ncbi:MAG: nucleotidyltransferase domain-containing protein [bacterium]
MTLLEKVRLHREEILRLAAEHGAYNVRLFGSVVRGEEGPESDVDLLILMERGRSLYDWVRLEAAISELLACPVDVSIETEAVTEGQRQILREAVVL